MGLNKLDVERHIIEHEIIGPYYTISQLRSEGGSDLIGDHNGHTVHDTFNHLLNRGKSSAITVTLTGGLDVSWTSGEIYDESNHLFIATTSGSGNLTDNLSNYLKWVSGTGLTLSTSISGSDEILIGIFSVYDGVINSYRETSIMSESVANTRRGLREIIPVRIISGMSVSEDTDATNALDVTMDTGVFWCCGIEKSTPIEIKSRNTAMVRHFHTGGVWDYDTNAEIDTVNYDNGTAKTALPVNKWVKALFLYMDGKIGWVYPDTYYNTEAQALIAPLPTIPPGLSQIPKLTAIVYQQGAANFTTTTWQDVRPGISEVSFTGVSDHGALAGLGDNDHPQYFLVDGQSDNIVNGTFDLTTTGELQSRYLRVNSTDGSDQITISHDNNNAFLKWNDGVMRFTTDEGTNTNSVFEVRGKGTGYGQFRIYDENNAEFLNVFSSVGEAVIQVDGISPARLSLQPGGNTDVIFFKSPSEGSIAELLIAGYRTGSGSAKIMRVGVEQDANDTVTFNGVSNYYFDGKVGIGTPTPDTKLQVVGDSKFGDDNTNYASFATDGELTLTGTARVLRHLRIGAGSLKLGASSPTAGLTGVFPHLAFSHIVNQEAHYQVIVPHRWDSSTDIELCFDWLYTGTQDNGTVKWGLEYISKAEGEDPTTGSVTISNASPGNHTTGELVRTCLTTKILASNLTAEDVFGMRIFRDQANDTLGTSAILLGIHFHYTQNKLGGVT